MHETEVLEKFSKVPVFSLSDVNQIIDSRNYAKAFLRRMCGKKKIIKVKKNLYTLSKDDFLISTFLVKPSYISSVSALSYYGLITQIPNEIFCATQKKTQRIGKINFFHTNYFFGYKEENYENTGILIAEPEKAVIDSFSVVPVSVFEEAFEDINLARAVEYLKKISKSSIVKRAGYLMEKNGYNVYDNLKSLINYKYIPLDPLLKNKGKKDKKWAIIDNIK
jgi:predicted transcriptional regulator of viral defense system